MPSHALGPSEQHRTGNCFTAYSGQKFDFKLLDRDGEILIPGLPTNRLPWH